MGEGSGRAALIAPAAPKPSLWARLVGWPQAEAAAQGLRWRLWAPVAFGGGCAAYFALKTEPPLWPLLGAAVVASLAWVLARRAGAGRVLTVPLMLLAFAACGLTAAKLRAIKVDAPVAPASAEAVAVRGWVVDVDSPGRMGARVILAPTSVEGLAPEETPIRVRATLKGEPPPPGTAIRLYGALNPPPAPVSPGAYDFGRNAWFQGIGGSLLTFGAARPADLAPAPWRLRLAMRVNRARFDLAQRIVERLGPRTGGVAAAMVTGQEAWLQQNDLDAMRDSGLAHILSISGLHMAVVGGFAFLLTRLGVASWPWLALRVPGKKVAAVFGLIAVGAYLVISGAPPPAERAAITASIAFVAILLDRPAITMQALAIAALAVLAWQPEAIVTPGFQMSFAATAALVALVEVWPRSHKEIDAPWPIVLVQRAGRWVAAAVAASVVAGLATGPFAMQHFNRTAVYGLGANLATSPIADFVMMPCLALGAVLEPLGLGAPFLWLAGQTIDAMLAIGHWTAGVPGAVRTVSSAPAAALPVAFLGVLLLCLWRGRLRWLGLPMAMAVVLWPRPSAPDLWIAEGARNAAWRVDRTAVLMRPGVGKFGTEMWSKRRGLATLDRPAEGFDCGRFSCAGQEGRSPVALWWGRRAPGPDALVGLCRSAEVVAVRARVARLPTDCVGRLVIDAVDFRRGGAVELWRAPGGWRASWTADARGDRPWSRFGEAEAEAAGTGF